MIINQPPLPPENLKLGIYKHFKGGFYKVLGVAKHENTGDELVVYRSISRGLENGEGPLYVRPLAQFTETVTVKDRHVPRYSYVSAK